MKSKLTKKRTFAIIIAFITVVFLTSYGVHKIRYADTKAKLISKTIEVALVSKKISDYNLIKDKHNIVLSSENMEGVSLPTLMNINLVVLSPEKIKEKANKEGDFLYLSLKDIDIGALHAKISLDNCWMKADSSKKMYLSGGGMIIDYINILGHWNIIDIEHWISFDSDVKCHHLAA